MTVRGVVCDCSPLGMGFVRADSRFWRRGAEYTEQSVRYTSSRVTQLFLSRDHHLPDVCSRSIEMTSMSERLDNLTNQCRDESAPFTLSTNDTVRSKKSVIEERKTPALARAGITYSRSDALLVQSGMAEQGDEFSLRKWSKILRFPCMRVSFCPLTVQFESGKVFSKGPTTSAEWRPERCERCTTSKSFSPLSPAITRQRSTQWMRTCNKSCQWTPAKRISSIVPVTRPPI